MLKAQLKVRFVRFFEPSSNTSSSFNNSLRTELQLTFTVRAQTRALQIKVLSIRALIWFGSARIQPYSGCKLTSPTLVSIPNAQQVSIDVFHGGVLKYTC